jgi:hypothetical protein
VLHLKSVGSQVNDGAMHNRDTWHRNHAKHANADDLRSRPNKVVQINLCTLNIPAFILPDYTYLPTHNSAPGQIHTTSNLTYPGTMARPQVIHVYDLRPKTALYGASYAIRLGSPPEDIHPACGKVLRLLAPPNSHSTWQRNPFQRLHVKIVIIGPYCT